MSKIGRNEPCPCGSGKKYKKCCEASDLKKEIEKSQPVKKEKPLFIENDSFPEPSEGEDAEVYQDPDLSEEENLLVNEWYEHYDNLEDLDEMRSHVEGFLEAYPQLAEYLELEVAYDLGEQYREENRTKEYIEFLDLLRTKHPNIYSQNAGFYDTEVIMYLISCKEFEKIPKYLTNIKNDPDEYFDQLEEVSGLLLAVGLDELASDLIKSTLPTVINNNDLFYCESLSVKAFFCLLPSYLHPVYSDNGVKSFIKDIDESFGLKLDETIWKANFANFHKPFKEWPKRLNKKSEDYTSFATGVSYNFARYLHEKYQLPLTTALFSSFHIGQYLLAAAPESKKLNTFDFSPGLMDEVLCRLHISFMIPDIAQLLCSLNSIYYFAEYLELCGNFTSDERRKVQENVKKLRDTTLSGFKEFRFPEMLCFPDFPFWSEEV
ncbi:SEC-C metal-binding domain-containing protein [Cytophagaceae bacterium ABcell3]|nr:SEC-C metal-binding domain-containing protein [Cytophagaceae bacterium ABcell3]